MVELTVRMTVDAEQLQFYQAFMYTFGTTAFIATAAWWRARRRVRELTRRVEEKLRVDGEVLGLLDDLSIEVERIGEGQRYLAKMLLNGDAPSADRLLTEGRASGLQHKRPNRVPDP